MAALLATTTLSFAAHAAEKGPRPMFKVIPRTSPDYAGTQKPAFPGTWNYSYTYKGATYHEQFIGADPSTGATEKVPVYLIPLKLSWTGGGKTTTEDAAGVIAQIKKSPLFSSKYDFTFGGTDIGKTQYEDALAKVDAWNLGGSSTGYHVLFNKPITTADQALTVPAGSGGTGTEFGASVLLVDINWLDPQINKLITSLKIPANALPIFVTSETYLVSGSISNCCIGGYHSVTNAGQPYSHFTYIKESGAFSQDVSALSHELAEWEADPYTNNNSPCGIFENGDPLERNANYGTFPYVLGGFTYHLQDIATFPYFGVPAGVTLNNITTLKGEKLAVCQNGA